MAGQDGKVLQGCFRDVLSCFKDVNVVIKLGGRATLKQVIHVAATITPVTCKERYL